MKRVNLAAVVIVLAELATMALGTRTLGAQHEQVARTELLKQELRSMGGKEAHVVLVEFEPGAVVGRHLHPGDELVYVLEGAIDLEVEGKRPVRLTAGEIYYQPPDQVHSARNASATEKGRLLAIWIVDKGRPLVVPVMK
jgi:quercetin dioxygenase-like cupin family protein